MPMTDDQVAEFIDDLVIAKLADRRPYLIGMINGLLDDLTGVDPVMVACTLAAAVSQSLRPEPGQDWYAFRPTRYTPDGRSVACSAEELRPWDRTFGQMTVAIANGEKVTARDLYVGYVNHQRANAARVIVVGLNQLAHIITCPSCCPDSLRRWRP